MEATTRDSEAMKVVSYITAVFFPAIFVAVSAHVLMFRRN